MLELKTKGNLAKEAQTLAHGSELVRYRNTTYMPVDFETPDPDTIPDRERTIWLPLRREVLRQIGADQFKTMFASDSELSSFEFMVSQAAEQQVGSIHTLLVRTEEGLKQLTHMGELHEVDGSFVPNALGPMLNTDPKDKERVFNTIAEWVDSEEDARSLIAHLATCLAPGWSAVKYVLLIGEGRNGKSVLMKMVQSLFGQDNVSNVTRQDMAEGTTAVLELNGKLVNIVYDGQAVYLKDSGREKSLIAGEPVPIKKLYESAPVMVQTNALFIEGLNREPKSNDKSSALQKRLVRFQFPNVYPEDKAFERSMLTEETLGAFLALLIDNYVNEYAVAKALAPTTKAMELQLEHMFVNSLALQFLKHLEDNAMTGAVGVLGTPMSELTSQFQSWRIKENDLGTWSEPDVQALFLPLVNTERRSERVNGQPRKVRVITSFKSEALAFLGTLKEVDVDAEAVMVED